VIGTNAKNLRGKWRATSGSAENAGKKQKERNEIPASAGMTSFAVIYTISQETLSPLNEGEDLCWISPFSKGGVRGI